METKRKIAQLVIARLDGTDISRRFTFYRSLVKQGIGGFIIFGGRLKEVREGIRKLQMAAAIPLFISSDLERGLGQQIEGGTQFPHAMAIAHAINRKKKSDISLFRRSVRIMAQEARAVGINTIFAPVMDVNTNPCNPIICTRAFSDDSEDTAWFGRAFIIGIQKEGIMACAKHFPGHGDTAQDSHRVLPVVKAGMKRLRRVELYPFHEAVKSKVRMMMVGHLKVPALDRSFPASQSLKTVKGLLRGKMGYKGLVITDAMDMKAVSGGTVKSEGNACIKALKAGVDIVLHPSDAERLLDYIADNSLGIQQRVEESFRRVIQAKKVLQKSYPSIKIGSVGRKENKDTAYELAWRALGERNVVISSDKKVSLMIIDDDDARSGRVFIQSVKERLGNVRVFYIDNKYRRLSHSVKGTYLIAAVFSRISAWKGRSGVSGSLMRILKKSIGISSYAVVIGFCSPYILEGLQADRVIQAYSDTEVTQDAAAMVFMPEC